MPTSTRPLPGSITHLVKPKRPVTRYGGSSPFEMGRLVEPRAPGGDSGLTLEEGAFMSAAPDPRHMARCTREAERIVSELAPIWAHLARSIEPDPMPRPAPERIEWPSAQQLKVDVQSRLERYRTILDRLLAGRRLALREALSIVDELATLGQAHPERFGQLALVTHGASDRLAAHGHATCCIAIGIAQRLGWASEHVRLAGLSGLLADSGMALVPDEVIRGAHALSDVDRNRVRRAPAFGVALLQQIDDLPSEVAQAVYQHHERADGSGYPEGIQANRITDLARVTAVSETFAAACARREYRMSKRPFDAVRELIDQAAAGELARPVVKALLSLTGLFPVGSYVALSNDLPALVVASNPQRIDRPSVMVLSVRPDGRAANLVIDLAGLEPSDLRVTRAIDAPARRLPAPTSSNS